MPKKAKTLLSTWEKFGRICNRQKKKSGGRSKRVGKNRNSCNTAKKAKFLTKIQTARFSEYFAGNGFIYATKSTFHVSLSNSGFVAGF